MIDFASVALPNLLPAPSASGIAVPGPAAAGAARFARTFGAFLADGDASDPPARRSGADRQTLAADGKALPDPPGHDTVSASDMPLLLGVPLPAPLAPRDAATPVPSEASRRDEFAAVAGATSPLSSAALQTVATALPRGEDGVALVEHRATGLPSTGVALQSDMPLTASLALPAARPSTVVNIASLPIGVTVGDAAMPTGAPASGPASTAAATAAAATLPIRNDAPAAIAVSPVPQPARAVFAAAIAAATGWRERAAKSVAADPAASPQVSVAITIPGAVEPSGAARDAPLDLGTDHGLRQTIDRIETLRDALHDATDARDTRIRLAPERLGGVGISVRREGDAVHVHFTAEREATQALLIDAQPRLAELATQRGVRIAETSVSTGTAQPHDPSSQQRQHPQAARLATNTAPVDAAAPDTTDDTRLA